MILPEFDKEGNMILNPRYMEIRKLDAMLKAANIPHVTERDMDGWHIWYPLRGERVISVIEKFGSYGSEVDTLEIMGLLTPEEEECDSVAGYLSAENVYERIARHYMEHFFQSAREQESAQ